MTRKIVVFGVTGNQGGSVARALLRDSGWQVVGITRNPDSAKAKAMADLGVTVVKGDLSEPESYATALSSAYGMFLMADFFAVYNGKDNAAEAQTIEVAECKAAVDGALIAGVRHIVYSSLESLPDHRLHEFDGKAEVSAYLKSIKAPATNVFVSYFFNNIKFFPVSVKEGAYIIPVDLPDDVPIYGFAVEQLGEWVKIAFDNPDKWIGHDMQAVAERTSYGEMAAVLSSVTGKNVTTPHKTAEQFLSDPGISPEMHKSSTAMLEHAFHPDIEEGRRVFPGAWGFREWAEQSPEVRKMFDC